MENNDVSFINQLKTILAQQNRTILPCEAKLGCNLQQYNTIPIMLRCKNNCRLFFGTGTYEDPIKKILKCFKTPFFRITKIYDDNLILLELLQAETFDEGSNRSFYPIEEKTLCDSFPLQKFIRTGCCIKVRIECFCFVECLPPTCAKHGTPKDNPCPPKPITVENSEYITISDGKKRIYYNCDGMDGYNQIPNPNLLSYTNLFINGMLQPPAFYAIEEGILKLNTDDIPLAGNYITLQFIKIKN